MTTDTDTPRRDQERHEYHIRQAFYLAENDAVRYHLRKAAQELKQQETREQ